MRTAAILPIKRFDAAKQRLGESVADGLRLALARAMVLDVLSVLAGCAGIELTIIVTSEPSVAALSADRSLVIRDEAEEGQSAAVSLGVARALADGFERVLCVPGDCPALDPVELDGLLEADASQEVVIVPDRHGSGTNGLLLSPPDAIPPAFGPGSCERHRVLAADAGVRVVTSRPRSLLLDVDTGSDLAVLRAQLVQIDGRARRTRAVLGSPEHAETLSLAAGA